jgi:glycosyltransferase involved in cell wall biosynthesis
MENRPTLSTTERTNKTASCGVSVAMATYNGDKYISEQLESIASQSVLPAEVVITDDCSSDSTIEIIQQFASTAPFPVKLVRNAERLGYAGNFFKACRSSSQPLIAFCD